MKIKLPASLLFAALTLLLNPGCTTIPKQTIAVKVGAADGARLPSRFLGLSYESSILLPQDGHYYFDATNQALISMFKTLGIESLRVGANAVDDPRIPIPQEPDIDMLFKFARAADVKVIYSFRLKNGDPADDAHLARYIMDHYAGTLDCFSIGNEPNLYPVRNYDRFYTHWKLIYDAILKAVPNATFEGPSADASYAKRLAQAVFADGHLAMVSDHYYFLGSGRAAETNAPGSRARFLSDLRHADYQKDYAALGAVMAQEGVPYRIDEMNSCYNGGAKDSSDTFASTLWALDCTHWWAAHHIVGVNYHTGESVGRDGKFGPPNYAAFLRQADGQGFVTRPQGYAYLAFTQGAHGQPLDVKIMSAPMFDFDAYAYRDNDGSLYLTLINKSYGDKAKTVAVTCELPASADSGIWQRMNLGQENQDVAAKTGVTLGGAAIDSQGTWSGQWEAVNAENSGKLSVQLAPASAAILHFTPTK